MPMRNVLPMECYSQDIKTFLPFWLFTMKNNLLPEEGGGILWFEGERRGGMSMKGKP